MAAVPQTWKQRVARWERAHPWQHAIALGLITAVTMVALFAVRESVYDGQVSMPTAVFAGLFWGLVVLLTWRYRPAILPRSLAQPWLAAGAFGVICDAFMIGLALLKSPKLSLGTTVLILVFIWCLAFITGGLALRPNRSGGSGDPGREDR